MTDLDQLYQAVIVEHDRHPRNRGPLAGATHTATVDNPLCGDVCTVELIVDGDVVRSASFDGQGCALSRAAASIMTEQLPDRDLAAVRALAADFAEFVKADTVDGAGLGELAAFAGVRRFRSRQACATLPFRALLAALR